MSTPNTYDVGDRVRLTGSFYDLAEALASPTAVVCRVLSPSGVASTPATANPSTGVYTADVDADEDGYWAYRFEGTGAVVAAGEARFIVSPSLFP